MRNALRGTIVREDIGWAGDWSWPILIGVLPRPNAPEFVDLIGSLDLVRSGLGQVAVLGRDINQCDLLIMAEDPTGREVQEFMRHANAVFVGSGENTLDKRLLERLLEKHKFGAISTASIGQRDLPNVVGGLLANLSRHQSFDRAVDGATTSNVTTVASADFLGAVTHEGSLRSLAGRSAALSNAGSVAIPHVFRNSYGLGRNSVKVIGSALPGMLNDMASAVNPEASFAPPSSAVAMQQRIDDLGSGPNERSADFQILPRNLDDTLGDPVPDEQALVPGRYVLTVALRVVRRGIGFDRRAIKPIKIRTTKGAQIVVAVQVEEQALALEETAQSIFLPASGDSNEAYFPFSLAAGCGFATFDIRFYVNLNLIEHIKLQVYSEETPPKQVAHLTVSQPTMFDRFSGDFADACTPRALSIQVSQKGQQFYLAVAVPAEQSVQLVATPGLASNDLAAAILNLRELWLKIALETFKAGLKPNVKSVAAQDILDLAKAGRRLWSLLFEMDLESIRVIGASISTSLPLDAKLQITIDETAQTFVFPWALIYDGSPPKVAADVDFERFWGVRYDIEQVIQRRKYRVPRKAGNRSAALFFNLRIGQAKGLPEKLAKLGKSKGAKASVTMPAVEDREGFVSCLANAQHDLLYFYCHGQTALPASPLRDALLQSAERSTLEQIRPDWFTGLFSTDVTANDSLLMLTKDHLKLSELWSIPVSPDGVSPIVILNMCESAQLFPEVGSSFIKFFLNRPARSVIGTECPVPPDFAADMGEKLMAMLLEGRPIGQALLQLRRDYLANHKNPLGLAYTLWGSTSASLA